MKNVSGESRREKILQILENSDLPVTGTALARELGVSRQIIVQDIALLRAKEKNNLLATARGYLLQEKKRKVQRTFTVYHDENEAENELNIFVDCGGRVLNVMVEHEVYGFITADLIVANRMEVREFIKKLKKTKTSLLSQLTGGVHSHTVEAQSEEVLNCIEEQLKLNHYLIIQ
ncbi:MAG: 3H domain-containing protein [Lachnospiraceae bacterium]